MITSAPIQGPKLYVIGHARSGKDTVCELLVKRLGLLMTASSHFCAQRFIFKVLKDKYHYQTVDECFNDRHNHRAEWFNLIAAYNAEDPTRLTRAIFEENHIYCGIRSRREFEASLRMHIPDITIWVDAHKRVADESAESMQLKPWDAEYVISNNGTERALSYQVDKAIDALGLEPEWVL